MTKVLGIHHITAMAGDPQANVNFYAGTLGLRLVKKTVNFDDPFTYHLYFGDESGNPGTIMTFFPWTERGLKGRCGNGQVTTTAFSIPADAIGFWVDRLKQNGTDIQGPFQRFDEEVIAFEDPDGVGLELVASGHDNRAGWENGTVPGDKAIRSFHGATLAVEGYERTAGVLTAQLGFQSAGETGSRFRFSVKGSTPGNIVDILCQPDANAGTIGVGTVHHIAWRAADNAAQLHLRENLIAAGHKVTPVLDRNYFHSIYFREPGHVLFEIATDPPGFTVDESRKELGSSLKLPSWLEENRATIEARLPVISQPKT